MGTNSTHDLTFVVGYFILLRCKSLIQWGRNGLGNISIHPIIHPDSFINADYPF